MDREDVQKDHCTFYIRVYHGFGWTQDWIVQALTEREAIAKIKEQFVKSHPIKLFGTVVWIRYITSECYLVE